jgi:hypothetical protein
MGPGQQADSVGGKGGTHAEYIGITLGMDQAREAITAITFSATAKGHVGLIQHHASGGMERMQSSAA